MNLQRRALVCLAFATWCFADTWVGYTNADIPYFARFPPLRTVVIPVLVWETLLTLLLLAAWEICRRAQLSSRPVVHILFLLSCLLPAGMGASALLRRMPIHLGAVIHSRLLWPMALTAVLLLFVLFRNRPFGCSRIARSLLLNSGPILLLIVLLDVRVILHHPAAAYSDGETASALRNAPPKTRLIWIIFDEMSQTVAFDRRPADLTLPNLDRLRRESLFATAAEAPATETLTSMPSLILGEKVLQVSPQGPDELDVRFGARKQLAPWNTLPNVFDSARALGLNTALAGWYHPYGRELNRSLTRCYWTAIRLTPGTEEPASPRSLPGGMMDRLQFKFVEMAGRAPGLYTQGYRRRQAIDRAWYLIQRAREIASDASIGMALLHLPMPHSPPIYDRKRGAFSADAGTGYLDNLALADATFGLLRQSMEQAGLWDKTAILVSADHGWRTALWRNGRDWTARDEAESHQDTSGVPFILRLPQEHAGTLYTGRFSTVVTRALITEVLQGGITSFAEAAALLDGAR